MVKRLEPLVTTLAGLVGGGCDGEDEAGCGELTGVAGPELSGCAAQLATRTPTTSAPPSRFMASRRYASWSEFRVQYDPLTARSWRATIAFRLTRAFYFPLRPPSFTSIARVYSGCAMRSVRRVLIPALLLAGCSL